MTAMLKWTAAKRICLGVLVLSCPSVSPAGQTQHPTSAEARYDIEAKPLHLALTELGTISHLDVLFESAVVSGKRSNQVSGLHSPASALSTMLRGTGLSYRFTSANAVLVFLTRGDHPGPSADAAAAEAGAAPRMILDVLRVTAVPVIGTPPRDMFEPFGRAVRDAINERLQNDSRTSGQKFRARLSVRINDRGEIERLDLVRPTGNSRLDGNIRLVLAAVRVGLVPPRRLPQPIWFDIVAR